MSQDLSEAQKPTALSNNAKMNEKPESPNNISYSSKDKMKNDPNSASKVTSPNIQRERKLTSEPSEDVVDPRVQVELEKLNTATDLINKLEIELDDARANFRLLLTESSQRINQMAAKLGNCIDRARPYYEARMRAKELQQETQKAALRFERASSAHAAAKEMVKLSEEGLCKEGRTFDPAWQEMLNHATMKVNDSEHERRSSKAAHQRMSQAYNAAEQYVQQLHVLLKKSIVKSSLSTRRSLLQLNNLANQHQLQLLPYFEMKAQFNQLLEEQKRKVQQLEESVMKVKMGYSEALHNLERISDEIHTRRKMRDKVEGTPSKEPSEDSQRKLDGNEDSYLKYVTETRTEGVGAEDPPPILHSPKNYIGSTPFQNSSNANKPIDLPLQKISLAEMEELTPMTPGLRMFSPTYRDSAISSITKESLKNFEWDESSQASSMEPVEKNVAKLYHLAKNVADSIGLSYPTTGESLAARGVTDDHPENNSSHLRRSTSPGASLVAVGGSNNSTPLRNPNFDPRRVTQREELLSDTESLASTDTADTLDDHHIECLLLDKVLEQDYQDILASTADLTTSVTP